MGLPLGPNELITAPKVAASYLRRLGAPSVRLVLSEDATTEFAEFSVDEDQPDVIIIGDIGDAWDYDLMSQLFEALVAGSQLVALHKGRYYQGPDGLILDIGAFVTGLEYASGTDAVVIGKPSPQYFRLAVESMGIQPHEAAMVGDDIESDVGGAQAAGLRGILARTGKFRQHLVESSSVEPDAVIDSIADLPAILGLPS
jgi:HAD superfamily hydrolase (TIGR01458 family)